jgi:hypothetical protein
MCFCAETALSFLLIAVPTVLPIEPPRTRKVGSRCNLQAERRQRLSGLCVGFELVDATVGHEGQKEVAVAERVRAHKSEIAGKSIVQRSGRTGRTREGERANRELIPRRLPRPAPTVAVDACADSILRSEREGVFRSIVRRQRRVVAALELHDRQDVPVRSRFSGAGDAGGSDTDVRRMRTETSLPFPWVRTGWDVSVVNTRLPPTLIRARTT